MTRRSGKFYRKNESEIMKLLGLEPTTNSGSTWIEKSDGQSEHLICELKSTDKQSIRINLYDLHTLDYNAMVSHKLPIFVIQFLESHELYMLVKPENISDVAKYLNTEKININDRIIDLNLNVEKTDDKVKINKIKSSSEAKKQYQQEQEEKYKKEKKAY